MNLIIEIYYENKGRYGYRRITLELNNRGFEINHKKVLRLMNKMGLHSIVRRKRKYSSYKGTVGKVADNLIERNFEAYRCQHKNVHFRSFKNAQLFSSSCIFVIVF